MQTASKSASLPRLSRNHPAPAFRLRAAAWSLAAMLSATVAWAQSKPDIVVFDQVGPTDAYYDASYGFSTAPSAITLGGPSNDKLTVVTSGSFQYGAFGWRGAAGGAWKIFIANPAWKPKDATGYTYVEFVVNGPSAIPAEMLPRLGLESSPPDVSTAALVALGSYLPEGIDGDSGTWQAVKIPMTDFEPLPAGFEMSMVKDVWFAQNAADGTSRNLWVDMIRITTGDGGPPVLPPATPKNLVAYAGDRSTVLHWDRSPEPSVVGYQVYGVTPRSMVKITPDLLPNPSFAHLNVDNGKKYYYAVKAVDYKNQESPMSVTTNVVPAAFADDHAFLDYVQRTAFDYFWYEANPTNGLVRDRSTLESAASMASTGFGLTAMGIGIDHGWITREQGRDRVLRTLRTLWNNPQGPDQTGVIGYKGWFYHFVDLNTGLRNSTTELSSIDTALLLGGVLHAKQYFDEPHADEAEIRSLADSIYGRVDWTWMTDGQSTLTMGWNPGGAGFIGARWVGYNEGMILYLLALGAAQGPLPPESWAGWTAGYEWATHNGFSFVQFPPLFGHQYSHCWVDFRHSADAYTRGRGTTYFENSRRATLAQRAYCLQNPGGFAGYSDTIWGLTACDGPGTGGKFGYIARGAPPAQNDDGTLAPTAAGGSFPFTPTESLAALRAMYDQYRTNIWTGYGFTDAFNPGANWAGPSVIGIDQGPILLMIENQRTQRVWDRFMKNPEIQLGMQRAGFQPVVAVGALNPQLAVGSFGLQWGSVPGGAYQVEYSPDLSTWWFSPTGSKSGTGGPVAWDDAGPPSTASDPAAAAQRYYRVLSYGVGP